MIGFMTPHMSGSDVSFSTSTNALLEYLDANPVWAVGDEMLYTESDPIERELSTGLLNDPEAWAALRSGLRERRSLDALRGLVAYLDGVRETRKAVIAVTMGWRLFRQNEGRTSDLGRTGRIVGVEPVGVGPDGVLGTPYRSRTGGPSRPTCDSSRCSAPASRGANRSSRMG